MLSIALIGAMTGQLLYGVLSDGFTMDEPVYIASGYRHLTASDYRLDPETPPLAKMVAAIPLLGLRLRVPEGRRDWGFVYRFVFLENDATRILIRARLPFVVLACILALVVAAWARETSGAATALIALVLIAFHPTLLAHGHLATTDMLSALAMTAASYAYWQWERRPHTTAALAIAIFCAGAILTRLSGLIWPIVLLVLLSVHLWRTPRAQRSACLRQAAGLLATLALATPLFVWMTYGFHYQGGPRDAVLRTITPDLGLAGSVIAWLGAHRLLPEAFLEAFRFQLDHAHEGHCAYLLGRVSQHGWPSYPLVAFATKSTPGILLACVIAAFRPRAAFGRVGWHALAPMAISVIAASLSPIQIGERYMIAAYPYLILVLASSLSDLTRAPIGRAVLGIVLSLHVVPDLLALRGGHLAYFNVLAGGARGGHRVLADSNLDWGQDLPRLKKWMDARGVESIQLGYHGSDDPHRLGIAYEDLPGEHLYPSSRNPAPFRGCVVVSPNLLVGISDRNAAHAYEWLRGRPADDRAGVFFVYRFSGNEAPQ